MGRTGIYMAMGVREGGKEPTAPSLCFAFYLDDANE
jgi:hypothetical protein